MEYQDPSTQKLYHRKMKCIQLFNAISTSDMIKYLRKRHEKYLETVKDDQMQDLIERLRAAISKTKDSPFQNTNKIDSKSIYSKYQNVDLNKMDTDQLNKEKALVLFRKIWTSCLTRTTSSLETPALSSTNKKSSSPP